MDVPALLYRPSRFANEAAQNVNCRSAASPAEDINGDANEVAMSVCACADVGEGGGGHHVCYAAMHCTPLKYSSHVPSSYRRGCGNSWVVPLSLFCHHHHDYSPHSPFFLPFRIFVGSSTALSRFLLKMSCKMHSTVLDLRRKGSTIHLYINRYIYLDGYAKRHCPRPSKQ